MEPVKRFRSEGSIHETLGFERFRSEGSIHEMLGSERFRRNGTGSERFRSEGSIHETLGFERFRSEGSTHETALLKNGLDIISNMYENNTVYRLPIFRNMVCVCI